MTTTSRLTATKLRLILAAVMLLLVALGIGAFIFGRNIITHYAVDAQQTAADAAASSSELDRLSAMKTALAANEATVKKTTQLVSESKLYVYQDKIIDDITKYANAAGLKVTNISFSDIKTGAASTATTTPNAATPTAAMPASLKSRTATVTLQNPVDYFQMLNFIHSIEQGLFRMHVTSVGLSRSPDGGVSSDVLTIEVYVR